MKRALFIDIRDEEVTVYIFERKKSAYEISEIKKYPMHNKYQPSLDDIPVDIDTAFLSIPIKILNFRVINLPFSDKDKIREVLPFELEGLILKGTDSIIFDNIVIGSSEKNYQVLVVYIDKTKIQQILDNLKTYNIDPEFMTSLELRYILRNFHLEKLLKPLSIDDKERITLALEEIKKPTINLRRDEFAYTRSIKEKKKSLKITALIIILIVITLSADLLLKIVSAQSEINYYKKEIRKVYKELFPKEKNIMNELYQLKSHIEELKNKEELFIGVNPLRILLDLSQTNLKGITFNEVTTQNGNIILKGEAPSLHDLQDIEAKLEQFFNDVKISDSKTSANNTIVFSITAKEKSI